MVTMIMMIRLLMAVMVMMTTMIIMIGWSTSDAVGDDDYTTRGVRWMIKSGNGGSSLMALNEC